MTAGIPQEPKGRGPVRKSEQLSSEQLIRLQGELSAAGRLKQADFTALFGHIAAVQNASTELAEINGTMSALLTDTANALKGDPAPRHAHSWHDLPKVAAAVKAQADTRIRYI